MSNQFLNDERQQEVMQIISIEVGRFFEQLIDGVGRENGYLFEGIIEAVESGVYRATKEHLESKMSK